MTCLLTENLRRLRFQIHSAFTLLTVSCYKFASNSSLSPSSILINLWGRASYFGLFYCISSGKCEGKSFCWAHYFQFTSRFVKKKKKPTQECKRIRSPLFSDIFLCLFRLATNLQSSFLFPFFLSFFLAVYYWSRFFCSCYCAYRQWPSPPRDPGWCNHHQLPLNQHVFISVIFQSSECAAPEQSVNQSPKQNSRQRERKRFREENLIFC